MRHKLDLRHKEFFVDKKKKMERREKFFQKTPYENKQVKNYEKVTSLIIGMKNYYLPDDFWI